MKKFTSLIAILLLCAATLFAQAPEKFSYQAVVRNANNALVTNAPVGVRVSILQGSEFGNSVYVETHTVSTNANGLMTVEIGGGGILHGSFADIDWVNGPYFLKTEIDPNNGTNYSITSIQQLLSVPYALYSKEAGNGFSGDYNDLTNTPDIPTVPTDVSAFNNDAGYLTSYTEQQILTISNDTIFLTGGSFVKLPAGFDGDYNSLTNRPTIPSTVGELTNDANYITMEQVPAQVNADWNATEGAAEILNKPELFSGDYNDLTNTPVLFSGDYNDLTNTPDIPTVPTDVSAFNNDAGYITMDSIPNIPTIPANVSAFSNDAGYIVNTSSCTDSVDLCALLDRLEMLENQLEPIMILTQGVTAVTQHSFTVSGKVQTDGSSTVTQRGFVYASSNPNPTLSDSHVTNGSGNGTFTSTITGLTAGITYYVRAYATNQNGTFYGSEVAVTTTATTPSTLPSVTTIAVTDITVNKATVRGAVTSDGGENVTQRGFVYDTLPNPTTNSTVVYHGTGTGQFSNLLTSLLSGKTYYVRAFAINSIGVSYGNELTFITGLPTPVSGDAIPCPATPTVTDHEGNVYNTVKIGTQCWTKENMRATTSPSTGTYLIPPAGTTHTCSGKQARWYNDDSTTYAPRNYGLLYNWLAAIDTFDVEYGEISMNGNNGFGLFISNNRRGICPEGWHVPSGEEWDQLTSYLNSHLEYQSGAVAGYVAKALTSTIDWQMNNTTYAPGNDLNANNTSGFNALPAGVYNKGGDYYHTIGTHAWFWSTSYSANGAHAHSCRIENNRPEVFVDHAYALNMCSCASVRCLRDIPCTEPIDTTTVNYGIPCPGTPTVSDIDGNSYNTVQIGQQCWMKENLRTTHFANGESIDNGIHSIMSYEHPYGYFNGPADDIYGFYYNGVAATDSRNICPTGWHVPSDAEWTQLTDYVSNQNGFICSSNQNIAKSLANTSGWNESEYVCTPGYNQSENNATGFSAFPAGRVYGGYNNIGELANFWTSTKESVPTGDVYRVISRSIGFYYSDVQSSNWYDYSAYKIDGKSVRCIKN